jgi:MATE family multidrug resistance protein
MTGYPAPLTQRRVWALVLPIIASNLTTPLMGAVDTAMMGHLPDAAYIGGVALGALMFNYLYWTFGFLRMATTGFAAQAQGAGRDDELGAVVARAGVLALAIGVLLIALQWPLAEFAFFVLAGSERVESLARDYVLVRIWGAPAALLTFVALGWLIGTAHMRTILALTVAQNLLNAALAVFFVLERGWGIEGIAAATLIAEYAGALLALGVVARFCPQLGSALRSPGLFARAPLLGLLRVNTDIFLRTLCLVTAFGWFVSQGAAQGDVVLAANAVLITLTMFAAYGLDGFANAAETLAGAAVGARDRTRFERAVRLTTASSGALAAAATLVFLLLGPALIALLTTDTAVRAEALRFLPWAAAYPIVAVWCFQLDGIYIGATRTREMRNGMLLALLALLAAGYGLMPIFGNHGLWAAFLLFYAGRGVILALWYPRIGRSLDPLASLGRSPASAYKRET